MQFDFTEDIHRPIEEVFAYLSKHENHKEFVKENKDSVQISEGPMGVGTVVQNTAKFLWIDMVERFTVTEFVPNRTIAKRSEEGSTFETTDRFELSEIPGGTRVALTVTAAPRGLYKVFFTMLTPVLRKSFGMSLVRLKKILEARPTASTTPATEKA